MKLKEAINKYKLDKRRNWFSFCGNIVYNFNYTSPCSGCSCDCGDGYPCNHGNSGCHECGYTGKRKSGVPVPAMNENNEPIKITDKDFTYAK